MRLMERLRLAVGMDSFYHMECPCASSHIVPLPGAAVVWRTGHWVLSRWAVTGRRRGLFSVLHANGRIPEAGNGNEAADAVELIRQEEAAHGNDVQALSIDGVGFNGPVLRELEDPDGLNIDTYVPPPKDNESPTLTPDDFEEDAERGVVT